MSIMHYPGSRRLQADPQTLLDALNSTPNASIDQQAVAISAGAFGLGLSAKTDLPANHPIFLIPTAALIGSDPASHLPANIRDPLLKHPSQAMDNPTIHLAVTLLHLSFCAFDSTASPLALPLWDTYINSLPNSVDSPAYLTPNDLEWLPAHFPAFDHARDINNALHNLFSSSTDSKDLSFGHLLHATLAPNLADRATFFSRFVWAYAMYIATQSGGLQFITTRPVKADESLTLKYNDLSNADELVYYGFAQPANPIPDPVILSLPPLPESDHPALSAIKRALLMDARPIDNLAMQHTITEMATAANVLFSARVHVATQAELTNVLKVKDPTRTADLDAHKLLHGISDENDSRAYALITSPSGPFAK
ncbi:hypothetical protein BCR44DRAFT_1496492 [Catenaria anguillulae PL171]|uniref:SET domain-containing protein n=1 Tax=Catenaria anguillulae PL171 TaxID=765915 RepID=A0A1Y2HYJ8_9FUNG|nr:hypothetical protein BCR44DRAFT_1496492 [Catenaria anguillulae PL171]